MLGIAFGEMVNWRTKPATGPLGKLDSMWDDGVYLGVRGKSGELNVQLRLSWEFRGERPTMIPRLTENDAKSPFSSLVREGVAEE